jgi:hypothetical protein
MKDMMLDIEAMGTGHNAAIVQIGACYFDRKTGKIGSKFKVNVDLRSSIDAGLSINGETIYWWLEQSDAARKSILEKPKKKITPALNELKAFAKKAKTIWSHSSYDFTIINNAMIACGFKPLNYRYARDIRTLTDLGGKGKNDFKREGTHHDAMDDCIFQVKYCVAAIQNLKGDK